MFSASLASLSKNHGFTTTYTFSTFPPIPPHDKEDPSNESHLAVSASSPKGGYSSNTCEDNYESKAQRRPLKVFQAGTFNTDHERHLKAAYGKEPKFRHRRILSEAIETRIFMTTWSALFHLVLGEVRSRHGGSIRLRGPNLQSRSLVRSIS